MNANAHLWQNIFTNLFIIALMLYETVLDGENGFLKVSFQLCGGTTLFYALWWGSSQIFVTLTLILMLWIGCAYSLGSPRNSALTLVALAGAFVSVFIFPPLALPEPFGPHEVGVFDTYVPLSPSASESSHAFANVRVLFPAVVTKKRFLAPIDTSYYLPEDLKICDEFMQFGGPSFLKNFGFLLHYWHLIRPHFWKGSTLLESTSRFHVVVYSHGLGGTNALYSTQATNLASYGYVVMMVEHTDGSAPLTKLQSGEILEHYKDIYKLRNDPEHPNTPWDTPIYVKGRRKQLLTRVEEVSEVAAWAKEAFLPESTTSLPPPLESFRGKLDVSKGVHLVGHSFGGATVLSAGGRHPSLFRSVVAHDPAVDWMTDDTRYNLLKKSSFEGSGGYEGGVEAMKAKESKGLESLPVSMIYCSDWVKIKLGHSFVTIDGLNAGMLGKKGKSEGHIISDSKHFEFSDNSLIIPTWLGTSLGFTFGDPVRVAAEVGRKTKSFLDRN